MTAQSPQIGLFTAGPLSSDSLDLRRLGFQTVRKYLGKSAIGVENGLN
jgi:hypothetical protein